MDNILTNGKRVLAVVVSAATILWAVGIAAFAVPQTAHAASAGDVIKGTSLSAVYYYGYDGQRYTFPNEKTFMTWFESFEEADIQTLSDSALADLTLAGNVVYRPGSVWIKITSVANTYAVAPNGMIHWIETEAVATDFDGSDWNTNIEDVPDVFFADYTEGASLMSADAFDGMMYMDGTDYMLAWAGEARMLTSNGRDANRMQDRFFLDGTGIDDSALTSGADITANICDLTDVAQTGCTDTSGGELEFSLASDTPASTTVPDTASGVEVAKFKVMANEATTLTSLAVHLTGLATADDIAGNGVYLYEGNARLTDGRTVNASTKKATFAGLNMEFDDNETRYISVRVDMGDNDANRSFAFEIASEDDIETNGTADGDFPITGNEHDIVDLDVGEVTIDLTGSLNDPTLGSQDAVVAKFNLEAGTEEDVEVEAITLNIDAAGDHSDFVLWQGGDEVAMGEYIGDEKVLFEFDSPFALGEGEDRDFQVSLDVGGNVDDTITTWLDNDADLSAIGSEFGFGVSVVREGYDGGTDDGAEDGGNCAADGDDCSFVTILGGDVTVAFNGPTAGDVRNGADEALLFDFTITAERFVTVEGFTFSLDGTDLFDGTAAIEDIKVIDADGGLVAGPEEIAGDGPVDVDFTDTFSINAGESLDLQLVVDIDDAVAVEDDTLSATLDMSEWDIEDEDGDTVTDIVPTSDLAGNDQTIVDSSLTVTLSATPSGESTYVKGASDVEVVGYNFTAGTGSDVEVTDLQVAVYVDDDGGDAYTANTEGGLTAEDKISSCSLYDSADDSLIDGPESPDADGDITFESFSWMIAAGDTSTMNVLCNIANVDAVSGGSDEFAFEIEVDGDVDALDEDGDSIDATATAINGAETVTVSIVDNGELSVSLSSDTPDDEFVTTESDMVHVAAFRFDSEFESFLVDRLTVTEEQGEDDSRVVTTFPDGEENSNIYANNIEKVYLEYPIDGTTEVVSGSLTGNERTFDGIDFWVEQDEPAVVDVYVDVSKTDRSSGGSAESNERFRMGLSANSGEAEFRAVGQSSGETLNEDSDEASSGETFEDHFAGESTYGAADLDTISGDPDLGVFRVRETVPTVTLSASTPSGSNFTPGDQEVLRFTVAASSNEDVILKGILFDVSTSDADATDWNFCDGGTTGEITVADFDFYNLSGAGTSDALDVDGDWELLTTDGTVCTADTDTVDYAQLTLTDEETIPAGTPYTYSLYFDSTGASPDPSDSVQFLVAGDPILSTFLTPATDSQLQEADLSGTDNQITVSDSSDFLVGDVICIDTADNGCGTDDERAFVTEIVNGTTLEVVRGYLNTRPAAPADHDANDDIDRLPGALLWQDDGNDTISESEEEYFGAFMVDSLPLAGSNTIGF